MGNGCKAQTRRERVSGKDDGKTAKSQLKVNEAAKSIICNVCRTTFLCTANAKQLTEHAENKHGKKMEECFNK
jgi:hypothetical protein